jgi:hypothetical protein
VVSKKDLGSLLNNLSKQRETKTMLKAFCILIIVYRMQNSQALSFLPSLTSNGSPLCAVGYPSSTLKVDDIIGIPNGVPGATKCAFYCTGLNSKTNCTGYNYLTSGLCQFFSNLLSYCDSTIRGCSYYYLVNFILMKLVFGLYLRQNFFSVELY